MFIIYVFCFIKKEISNSFDAISKVYACRVDDIWIKGSKLIKDFLAEANHTNKIYVTNNEIKIKPIRVCLKLFLF